MIVLCFCALLAGVKNKIWTAEPLVTGQTALPTEPNIPKKTKLQPKLSLLGGSQKPCRNNVTLQVALYLELLLDIIAIRNEAFAWF